MVELSAVATLIDASDTDLDKLEELCEGLAALCARAQARLVRYAQRQQKDLDRWVPPLEAAVIMGLKDRKGQTSARWIYEHWKEIPNCRKPSKHKLLISVNGIRQFMGRR